MKHERSKALFERAKMLMPGGVSSPVRAFRSVGLDPFVVKEGKGAYLIDEDGNEYVDYINSWGPLVLGHAHPVVVEALRKQIEKGTSYGACSALESELAELIIGKFPSIEMIRFVNSGTEAGMSVLRLARGFTGRDKIIKFSGCYHGHVDAMLVEAGSGVATLGIPACAGVLASNARDTLTARFNDLKSVEMLLDEHTGTVAAIIVEPVVGNAGFIKPVPGFLSGLQALARKADALLIFDEVMTGFRVDLRGAQGLFDVQPDLTMLGKVIGGGLPVGAFGGRREIMSLLAPLGNVYQAGTLSGNPLAMTAGIATLREGTKGNTFEQVAVAAKELVRVFREEAEKNSIPLTAGSAGSMFGFFFHPGPVNNYDDAKLSDLERFKRFFRLMLEHGVYFAPSQFEAGFVSTAHLGGPLEYTRTSLREVFSELARS
jgi:glutamate-1-semialdehyde 2,1-aminomutase